MKDLATRQAVFINPQFTAARRHVQAACLLLTEEEFNATALEQTVTAAR